MPLGAHPAQSAGWIGIFVCRREGDGGEVVTLPFFPRRNHYATPRETGA